MPQQKLVILGGGIGGVAAATRLAKNFDVTLVSSSDFVYYADIPKVFLEGLEPSAATVPLERLSAHGVRVVRDTVAHIDAANRSVHLESKATVGYDHLVVALGAEVSAAPHLWSLEGLIRFKQHFAGGAGRRLVVCVGGLPYRCPPAPFDVAYRLASYLARLGRTPGSVTVVHPEKQPLAAIGTHVYDALMESMSRVNVEVLGGFRVREVDWATRKIVSEDGEQVGFDVLHYVPKHTPPKAVADSELASTAGWGDVDIKMRSKKYDDVYMIGDIAAPTLGLPMAGFLALYGAEAVGSQLTGSAPRLGPEASCPVEAGANSLIPLCDFGPKLGGKSLPECSVARVDQRFMAFFRSMARTKLLSEAGL